MSNNNIEINTFSLCVCVCAFHSIINNCAFSFYIDHKTKTTSWEDPRWSNKQQVQSPGWSETEHC